MKLRLWDDWGWRLTSLAAAVVLWWTFSASQELNTTVSVPVQYRNLPARLDISSEAVVTIHLHLRGPASMLNRLSPQSTPVVLDLGRVSSPGERTFTLGESNLRLPAGVVVERIVPSQVRLRFEPRASREVRVIPRITGLPDGMQAASVEALPAYLNILGPKSRIERIGQVETDPVDLSGSPQGGEFQVNAYAGDPQVFFAGSAAVTVRVTLSAKSPSADTSK
jgi:YbbR domain-containing protein